MSETQLHHAVRDGAARAVGAVGLAGVALIHLLDIPGKLGETPYMFFMYLGLIASSLVLAGLLIHSGDRRLWAATGGLMLAVLTGFVLSRTTGLPSSTGDIGNWGEPLGMASLLVEGALLGLAGMMAGVRRPLARAVRVYAPSEQSRLLQEVA